MVQNFLAHLKDFNNEVGLCACFDTVLTDFVTA